MLLCLRDDRSQCCTEQVALVQQVLFIVNIILEYRVFATCQCFHYISVLLPLSQLFKCCKQLLFETHFSGIQPCSCSISVYCIHLDSCLMGHFTVPTFCIAYINLELNCLLFTISYAADCRVFNAFFTYMLVIWCIFFHFSMLFTVTQLFNASFLTGHVF